MTYKSNAVYICDQCGKEVPTDENRSAIAGWLELDQHQPDKDGDGWIMPEDLGDFCSFGCLALYIGQRLQNDSIPSRA